MSDVLTTLVSFEKPVEATPAVLRSLEELYMESLLAVWAEQGMENITPAEKTTPCRLYSARAEGRACLLVMPAPAAGYLHMQSLSAEPALLPHLWFRAADGRLSYICLGSAGEPRPEMLRLLSPYSGYRAVVAAGEVVQLEPLSIPSISTP